MATIEEIYYRFKDQLSSALAVTILIDDPDFKHGVLSRGVHWVRVDKKGHSTKLSSTQLYALSHVLSPTAAGNLTQRLRQIGVNWAQWQAWMKNPEFAQAVRVISADTMEEMAPHIQTSLIKQAEKGDVSAIKFWYEVTGRYDPNANKAIDVIAVLSGVVEIISKHVTDPAVLSKIGDDIRKLASRTGLDAHNRTVAGELTDGN